MKGKFLKGGQLEITETPWGPMQWISRPSVTKSPSLTVIIVDLAPGGFHNFHYHPGQEEVIYVLDGTVEQWIEGEKQVLKKGDSVYIDKDIVHASFNIGKKTAKLYVVLGPSRGKAGYRAVDASKRSAYKNLRPTS